LRKSSKSKTTSMMSIKMLRIVSKRLTT